jgi:spore germination protein GerM
VQDMVTIPVMFSSNVSSQEVSVFFVRGDGGEDCTALTEVSRRVPETRAIAQAAMTELLRGVDPSDSDDATSLIPFQAQVRSLVIENGVATITFTKDSFLGAAGSCMVAGIRAQIEATLKQFSTVSSVVILEEGKKSDEILQP